MKTKIIITAETVKDCEKLKCLKIKNCDNHFEKKKRKILIADCRYENAEY